MVGSQARRRDDSDDAEQLREVEFGRCEGRQRTCARRLCAARQRRRRVQALRHVVHDDPRSGHPRAGCGHLCRGSLLAGAVDPDQPELPALHGRGRLGCERRPAPRLRRHLQRGRSAAVPLQAPGAGGRARRRGGELRGDDRHGVREVAVFLHPHRQPCAGGTAGERTTAHASGCRLPDERARELPDGGAEQVHRSGTWRPADHVRPLHGAGGHGPAEAGGRRSAGHPPYQLHDARAPHDAAGGTRPPGHRQLRGPSLPRPGRAPHVPRPPGCRRGAAGAPCP